MTRDLKSMTRKELLKLKSDVEKALEKLAENDRKAALAAAEKAAAAHGFTLAEITADAPKKTRKAAAPKTASAPRYKDPADPSRTWTGKGRQPEWFKSALAAGKSPEDMEI